MGVDEDLREPRTTPGGNLGGVPDSGGLDSETRQSTQPRHARTRQVRGLLEHLTKIARLRARWYALGYILCIPLFASAYWHSPGDFYHSTVQYEPSFSRDREQLLSAISADATVELQGGTLNYSERSPGARALDVSFQQDKEGRRQFRVKLQVFGTTANGVSFFSTATVVAWFGNAVTLDPDTAKALTAYPIDDAASSFPTFSGTLVGPLTPHDYLPTDHLIPGMLVPALVLSTASVAQLESLSLESNGFSPGGLDGYLRLLYFSAITITTLGYGDILPVTTPMRLLVGFEALLGVVIAGLFINSLAQARPSQSG